MTKKLLSSGIGVNFEDRPLGTYVWLVFKGAVSDFQCKKTLSQSEREAMCSFLEKQERDRYFTYHNRTISAVPNVLVDDLMRAGFALDND